MAEGDVPLREHLEALIGLHERLMSVQLGAIERAVTKAEAAADRRFEGVNELRGVVTDVLARTMPREEYQRGHNDLIERISGLERNTIDRLNTTVAAINDALGRLADRVAVVEGITH